MALSDDEEFELLSLERQRGTPAARPDMASQINNDPISTDAHKELSRNSGLAAFRDAISLPWRANQTLGVLLDKGAYAAGGKATDVASSMGASPGTAAGIGTAVNAGIQAIPMVAGGEAAKVLAPSFRAGARDVMQSALKPTLKNLQNGNADNAITTLLDEGVNVTRGGVGRLQANVDDLNNQVTNAIATSGATVDKWQVGSRIQDVLRRIERTNPTPQDAMRDVNRVYDDFLNNGLVPQNIPVQRAQELKRGIYQVLRDKYGQLGSDTVEAQKALARGFKEEIAAAVPAIRPLNQRESALINALNVTERRVLMEANKNPAGLSLIAHNPGAFALFMADRSGLFKSLVARMMNSGAEQIPANAVRAGVGAATINNNSEKP